METELMETPIHSKVSQKGWVLHLWDDQTTAAKVRLWIGRRGDSGSRRLWGCWSPGESADLQVPVDLIGADGIWLKAQAEPHGSQVYMCLHFDGHVAKHMEFVEEVEVEAKQTDQAHCAC